MKSAILGFALAAAGCAAPTPPPGLSPAPTEETPSVAPSSSTVALSVEFPDRDHPFRVAIDDPAHLIVEARPAGIIDFQTAVDRHADMDAGAVNATERDLIVVWPGSTCDTSATLFVRQATFLIQPDPRRACDAIGTEHGMVLSTREPIDASMIEVTLGRQVVIP